MTEMIVFGLKVGEKVLDSTSSLKNVRKLQIKGFATKDLYTALIDNLDDVEKASEELSEHYGRKVEVGVSHRSRFDE